MEIDFDKMQGLVPVIVQDAASNSVLMLGFMNKEAFDKTEKEGRVTFYSRSKKRLWTKGETSGNFLNVKDVKIDCDNDTLLIKAEPVGPVCHKGTETCFGESNSNNDQVNFLQTLDAVISDRRNSPSEKSYTTSLFSSGANRIIQKVGEEAVELVIAAKDGDKSLIKEEAADLIFHMLVMLQERGVALNEVVEVLRQRHKPKSS